MAMRVGLWYRLNETETAVFQFGRLLSISEGSIFQIPIQHTYTIRMSIFLCSQLKSCITHICFVGVRVVHSLLQLSERWPCHIWLVDWMISDSLEAYLGGVEVF